VWFTVSVAPAFRPAGLALAFMAGRAVLRFVIIHRHFKHVVASDANAMNFRPVPGRRVMSRGLSRRSGGRCSRRRRRRRFRLLSCLAHAVNFITTRKRLKGQHLDVLFSRAADQDFFAPTQHSWPVAWFLGEEPLQEWCVSQDCFFPEQGKFLVVLFISSCPSSSVEADLR
jgi:hypothetical protein